LPPIAIAKATPTSRFSPNRIRSPGRITAPSESRSTCRQTALGHDKGPMLKESGGKIAKTRRAVKRYGGITSSQAGAGGRQRFPSAESRAARVGRIAIIARRFVWSLEPCGGQTDPLAGRGVSSLLMTGGGSGDESQFSPVVG
jgi:hypothetical protein